MSKQFHLINVMTPSQQRQAIHILKGIIKDADEQNPGQTGYCDHSDTHEIRMFLIKCNALPDRRTSFPKRKK